MRRILSLCLLCITLFAFVACQSDPVVVVHHVTNESELRAALEQDGEIILDNDITLKSKDGTVVDSLVVEEGKKFILDLNGHTILTDKYYVNNIYFMFDIKGNLVINDSKGGGIIGGDYTTGSTGALLVDTTGTLVLNDGVVIRTYPQTNDFYEGATYRPASVFVKGNLLVNDAKIYSSRSAIYAVESSDITVNGGEFYSIASVKNKQSYVYAMVLDGNAILNKCIVRGIHGALAIDGTETILNSDVQAYVTKDIFDKIPEEYGYKKFFNDTRKDEELELQDSEMFYALYCAGERKGHIAKVSVNGGTYKANNAVFIGNSGDGGAGEKAYATIKDGTFDGSIYVDSKNVDYGYGSLTLEGGKFLKNKNTLENLKKYIKADSGHVIDTETDATYFIVK